MTHSRNATTLFGINNAGQIVGNYDAAGEPTGGSTHLVGFSETAKGEFVNIEPPWSFHTWVQGISNLGQIVGYGYEDPTVGIANGFSYYQGIYQTVNVPNSISTEVYGVNDFGELVGAYLPDESSSRLGFVATPIPPIALSP